MTQMKRRKSLRVQYALIFAAIFVAAMAVVVLVNRLFLERFYDMEQENIISDVYERLNDLVEEDTVLSDIRGDISSITDEYNMSIIVVRDDASSLVIGAERSDNFLINRLLLYLSGDSDSAANCKRIYANSSYVIYRVQDNYSGTEYMETWGHLESGYKFLLRVPLESISNSVAISNQFFLCIGIAVTIIAIIIIFFFTRQITKPITALTSISEKMSEQDFSVRYQGGYDGELDVLGTSMNRMADELEIAFKELKDANEDLTKTIEYRKKLDEMRIDFINGVSHDLKTPLALIEGYAEGLKEGLADDPESREYYCDVICDEAVRMNRIVQKFIALNEFESEDYDVAMENFNIGELLKDIAEHNKMRAEKDGIDIECEADDCVVTADPIMIEEIINNYLSNAFHHAEERMGVKSIKLFTEVKDDGLVRVNVYNSGEGINEADIPKIWEKLYRTDRSRSREYGGNGIGLAIVKAVMEKHGHEYGVYNTETGPVFWFDLEVVNDDKEI